MDNIYYIKKVILITGASRGIGRNIAKTLAEEGNIVIANYNKSEEMAKDLQKKLQEKDINIDIYKADVSKREEVSKMVDFVIKKYGKIDVLINNAGIDEIKLFTDETDEDWNRIINNNLYSVFCTTQEVVKYMINRKQGNIINISSIWGIVGGSCEVLYSTTKAAIDGFTKSLAKELGLSNIRVNSIAPGVIDTDMNKHLVPEDIEELKSSTPLGRIGKPEDISKCVKWLIEDDFTTGQVISPNGGIVI